MIPIVYFNAYPVRIRNIVRPSSIQPHLPVLGRHPAPAFLRRRPRTAQDKETGAVCIVRTCSARGSHAVPESIQDGDRTGQGGKDPRAY